MSSATSHGNRNEEDHKSSSEVQNLASDSGSWRAFSQICTQEGRQIQSSSWCHRELISPEITLQCLLFSLTRFSSQSIQHPKYVFLFFSSLCQLAEGKCCWWWCWNSSLVAKFDDDFFPEGCASLCEDKSSGLLGCKGSVPLLFGLHWDIKAHRDDFFLFMCPCKPEVVRP